MATLPNVAPLDGITAAWANTLIAAINGISSGSGATASRPASGTPGQLWYDTTLKRLYQWDGTAWVIIGGSMPRCRVRTTAASVPNATPTGIPWQTEDFDTDGLHDTVTNNDRITIPNGMGGRWRIEWQFAWASNATGGRAHWVETNVDSTRWANMEIGANAAATAGTSLFASTELILTAGQWVRHVAFQSSGGALNISQASSYFGAQYIGPV